MPKIAVLVGTLLIATAAFAGLDEEIVGTWTLIAPESDVAFVLTCNADGTYQMEMVVGTMCIPVEQGTYVISGTDMTVYPVGEPPYAAEGVTVVGDQLTFYVPVDDVTIVAVRGGQIPEPQGTGSISGMVSYDGEVAAGITVFAMREEADGEWIPVGGAHVTAAGPYTVGGLSDGTYMVVAWLGIYAFGGQAGQAYVWGVYGVSEDLSDTEADPVVVAEGGHVEGIDIALHDYGFNFGDQPTARKNASWGAVKAAF